LQVHSIVLAYAPAIVAVWKHECSGCAITKRHVIKRSDFMRSAARGDSIGGGLHRKHWLL